MASSFPLPPLLPCPITGHRVNYSGQITSSKPRLTEDRLAVSERCAVRGRVLRNATGRSKSPTLEGTSFCPASERCASLNAFHSVSNWRLAVLLGLWKGSLNHSQCSDAAKFSLRLTAASLNESLFWAYAFPVRLALLRQDCFLQWQCVLSLHTRSKLGGL